MLGTGHLEVHVAEVILVAENVRQDGELLALLDEPHRDTLRPAALVGTPASISARLDPQTDAIELEPFDSSNLGDDANHVREIFHRPASLPARRGARRACRDRSRDASANR